MSKAKHINVFPLTLTIMFLLAALAGGLEFYSQQSSTIQVGTVTNVSVGFSGGTAETASVTVASDDGSLGASADIRAVPEGGDTIAVVRETGEKWHVPESAGLRASVMYPYSVGWIGLLGAETALFGIGLLVHSLTRRAPEIGTAQSESEQPAEELEETTSASTQTS